MCVGATKRLLAGNPPRSLARGVRETLIRDVAERHRQHRDDEEIIPPMQTHTITARREPPTSVRFHAVKSVHEIPQSSLTEYPSPEHMHDHVVRSGFTRAGIEEEH